MDAFDKLVEKHFPQAGPLQMLVEMVEKELDGFVPKKVLEEEKKDTKEVKIYLPIIKLTEDWGKVKKGEPRNEDRKIIEMYTKNIAGNTIGEKIAYLNDVTAGKQKGAKLKEILGTLVVLEILSSILEEFTESAGGFIFEAFLAGLFGGASIQIVKPEEESEQTGKPITDVVLNDRHYSLKLLGPGTVVKGSFKNMVEHFDKQPEIIYLDARRNKDNTALDFGEFRITLLEFMDVFYKPLMKEVTVKADEKGNTFKTAKDLKKGIKKLQKRGAVIKAIRFLGQKYPFSGKKMKVFTYSQAATALRESPVSPDKMKELIQQIMTDEGITDEFGPFQISYSERVFEKSKAKNLFGTLKRIKDINKAIETSDTAKILDLLRGSDGYTNSRQFVFSRTQVESIKGPGGFEVIGSLNLGKEALQKTWMEYGELLNATIGPVYQALESFSTNIGSYFLDVEDPTVNRRTFGMAAIGDADRLRGATDEAMKVVEEQ